MLAWPILHVLARHARVHLKFFIPSYKLYYHMEGHEVSPINTFLLLKHLPAGSCVLEMRKKIYYLNCNGYIPTIPLLCFCLISKELMTYRKCLCLFYRSRSFPKRPKYRTDPISDPVIDSPLTVTNPNYM